MPELFAWHQSAWEQVQRLKERMPHAIVFHGPHGTGAVEFAEALAQSLLCIAPLANGHACGQCEACGWFSHYAHPDFRRVRPEALDEEGEGEEGEAEPKKASKSKTPSKEIKIDQVRALSDFMNVSTHRQGYRVVLLHPAEALNAASANAILKTLEEPPPSTVFVLVSHAIERLLPTILSRCRKFALPMPPQQQALEWLTQQGIKDAQDWLAEQGGAPLAARDMAQAAQAGGRELQDEFLRALALPNVEVALKAAERLQKSPVAELVLWQQRWIYDLASLKLAGRIRYYPRYQKEITRLANQIDADELMRLQKAVNARRAVAEHPLAARLFIEDLLLEYAAAFSTQP